MLKIRALLYNWATDRNDDIDRMETLPGVNTH